jgi:hypothetical protein
MVGVPLLHVLHLVHLLGIAVGRAIVLGHVGLRVGVVGVVDGRVRLRRVVVLVGVLVLVIHLPAALVEGSARRDVAGHHGEQAAVLPRCQTLSETERPTCEATGACACVGGCKVRRDKGRRDGAAAGRVRAW